MRVLAVDYGDKRIGFALSDPLRIIASPLEIYVRQGIEKDLQYIGNLISAHSVSVMVMGLPYNMDGSKGERAQLAEEFGALLKENFGLPIHYQDERWTSVESERRLIEADVRRNKRKQVIDKIAAQIILQSFLDSPKNINTTR